MFRTLNFAICFLQNEVFSQFYLEIRILWENLFFEDKNSEISSKIYWRNFTYKKVGDDPGRK